MRIYLKDKKDVQLFFHFNDLLNQNKLNKLKNYKITDKVTEITVRWFDDYDTKVYNKSMTLITILKKGIKQIQKTNKTHNLNCCGLYYITKYKNKIKIEPQFS